MTDIVDGYFGGLTAERKAEAVRILSVNKCGEPVGYRTVLASSQVLDGYLLIGTTGYVGTDVDLEPHTVGSLHSLTGVTGHGVEGQLNRMTLDVDSEVTGFGTHNRLIVFGTTDGLYVQIREDVFADDSLPLSVEWQRQSIAHHPHHRLHPEGWTLRHVSSQPYDDGRCIEHIYAVVKP